MTIQVAAYRWVPPFAAGYVRDLRVRWALEEAGLSYEEVLIDHAAKDSPGYLRWQPFGQVPAYREGALELFESGAIVLHVARRSEVLAPKDEAGFARVMAWVFAALNSVEPSLAEVNAIDVLHAGEDWARIRRPQLLAQLSKRLDGVDRWLEGRDYLEHGRFTAGDLIMATVFRNAARAGALAEFPRLEAYRDRCLARPAFARALEAQLSTIARHAPATGAA